MFKKIIRDLKEANKQIDEGRKNLAKFDDELVQFHNELKATKVTYQELQDLMNADIEAEAGAKLDALGDTLSQETADIQAALDH